MTAPPSIWKKTKCGVREGERGGKDDSGLDGWWWMKQWRFSSGASVWCWAIWCHTAAVCRTLSLQQRLTLSPACCASVWLIYNDPWDKKYKYLDAKQNVWFAYMTWMRRTHLRCVNEINFSNKQKKKKTAFNNILYILALLIFFSFSYLFHIKYH